MYFSTAQLLSWKRAAGQDHPQNQPRLSCFLEAMRTTSYQGGVQVSLEMTLRRGQGGPLNFAVGRSPWAFYIFDTANAGAHCA